jgi:2-oxoglutarate dehydrogenase E2 component (dihydrolipoamide succinyltransferase)
MPTNIVVPELGESIIEATVASWLKKEGDRVSVGEPMVELETDKVDLEVGAPHDGILARIEIQAGEDVNVGDVLAILEEVPEGEVEQEVVAKEEEREEQDERRVEEVEEVRRKDEEPEEGEPEKAYQDRITPVARRLAQEYGIDLDEIEGTGPGQRITRHDVERQAAERKPRPSETRAPAPSPGAPSTPEAPQVERDGREERIRMSRRRRTIARRLVEAQQTAAMLTTFNDVDMSSVMDLRSQKRESFQEKHQVKLGIMSFFVKASIAALKAFPRLNAELSGEDAEELVLKHYYDIGIAIGAEEGLVVPVLRDADRLTFAEIEKKIIDFVQKSNEGTLSIDDLRGGTFSITNGGVFGSLLSTPILNPPQTGILGLHRIEDRPVAIAGQVAIHPMMYLALSYDHRVVDGREAVQFLRMIKELIEDPDDLLLEG